MSAAEVPVRPRPARGVERAPAVIAIGSVALLAIAGGVLAARVLFSSAGGDPASASAPARAGVGDDVPTSFGVIAVEEVRNVGGLSGRAVGGVTHFPSFVGVERAQVQVLVSLRNLRGRPVTYSANQFRLRAGPGRSEIAPRSPSFPSGSLAPGATIDTELAFIAPRDGSPLSLEFADGARAAPIVIDIGRMLRPRARSPGSSGHRH